MSAVFTGLVDDVGTVERVSTTNAGREFRLRCSYDALSDGESIAVNGVCLTVLRWGSGWFDVAGVTTTLERTTLGDWHEGKKVNLERALRLGDRLGGHLMQGHVDGVAVVERVVSREDALLADLALPPSLFELMVSRCSLAVDGVSLTVNDLPAPDVVQVSIIEFTRTHTALGALATGDSVHVEADMIAKHVQRLLAPYAARH